MKTPPYIQLTTALYYLAENLRRDTVLTQWLDVGPDSIIAYTCEYPPLKETRDQLVPVGPLPLLALYETNTSTKVVRGCIGHEVDLEMIYLFKPPVDDLNAPTKLRSTRISKLIWGRIVHWIDFKRTYNDAWPGTGSTSTLLSEGYIDNIWTVDMEHISVGNNFVGFKAGLGMRHKYPSYHVASAQLLQRIDGDYNYRGGFYDDDDVYSQKDDTYNIDPLMESISDGFQD